MSARPSRRVVVVGAGVFGLGAALELRRREHEVTIVDQGPVPHPLAASTDVSKVIRMEYGPDEPYTALAEEAREGWLAWNEAWRREGGEPLYHEIGVLMVSREPMRAGGFEYEGWRVLLKRGHAPERLDADALRRRFPAWSTGRYVDGFFHDKGGYAEAGRVVEALVGRVRREGITVREHARVSGLGERSGGVTGVRLEGGGTLAADEVVIAAGSWTGKLLSELREPIRPIGQPVFHLKPREPDLFAPERFPVFTADIAHTGYYGFPLNRDGVVKIANHGPGVLIDPDAPRRVAPRDHEQLRAFLAETFPALVDAEVVFTRLCLYADSQDGDFWIARDPARAGLTVASGGSGHGYKFAPVIGPIIADVVEGKPSPWAERFRWRPEVRMERGREAARYHAPESAG